MVQIKIFGGDKIMELNPVIKNSLEKINFIERYSILSNKYNDVKTPLNERLHYIDGEIIIESVESLGYKVEFEPKDKFFSIIEEQLNNKYRTLVKFDLNGGMVEFIWEVWANDKIILGSPWGTYSKKIERKNVKIKKPIFGTYEDLDDIFRVGFELYEDFKKALY